MITSFTILFISRLERMKDRETMIPFPHCNESPDEREESGRRYRKAERAEMIPIGAQMLYAQYVVTDGKNHSDKRHS